MKREKPRLNQTRSLASKKKPLVSKGREVLRKASACQGHQDCPGTLHQDSGGQLNRGVEEATNMGDWDASQAGPLESGKGVGKGRGHVEDLLSQDPGWQVTTDHHPLFHRRLMTLRSTVPKSYARSPPALLTMLSPRGLSTGQIPPRRFPLTWSCPRPLSSPTSRCGCPQGCWIWALEESMAQHEPPTLSLQDHRRCYLPW